MGIWGSDSEGQGEVAGIRWAYVYWEENQRRGEGDVRFCTAAAVSLPEAKGVVVWVGGIEEEGELIAANGVDIRGVFSEEFDGVVECVAGAEDVVFVFRLGGWEKGFLGCQ